MKVILLAGKAQNGKSTLANYIKENLEQQGKKVVLDRFAKYIKEYARQLGWDGVTKDECWRNFLQYVGTELIQEKLNIKTFHPKRLAEDIEILSNLGIEYFIIDDCRFRREINYIKSIFPNDTITVKVCRLDYDSPLTNEQKSHKSEIDLDGYFFDYTIFSQNGIDHLFDEARRVLKGVVF